MMYSISKHAKQQLEIRNINEELLDVIINNPDNIIVDEKCTHIFQKIIFVGSKEYLYRIFVNICKEPMLIITGYRTSKIGKYGN